MNGISRPGMSASFLNQLTTLLKKERTPLMKRLKNFFIELIALLMKEKYYRKAPYLIYDYEIVFVEHVF